MQIKFLKNFLNHFHRYQIGLETSMTGSDFIFDCVYLLHFKYHEINVNRDGSYIDSPDWIKNKKAATNPINKKDNMLSIRCNSCIKSQGNKKRPTQNNKN